MWVRRVRGGAAGRAGRRTRPTQVAALPARAWVPNQRRHAASSACVDNPHQASRPLGRLDLRDLELLLRPARNVDADDVAALVAEERLADRRLVRELLLRGVGLGRADDLELARV